MPVYIGRGADVRVPHPLLDLLEVAALVDKEAGAAVTQVVETDMRQTIFFQQLAEAVAHIVRGKGPPIGPAEHIVGLDIVLSQQPPVSLLVGPQRQEQVPHLRRQREAAVAAFGFSLVLGYRGVDLNHRMPDSEGVVFKVQAVPFEAQQLAAAKAIDDSRPNQRIQRLFLDSGQQGFQLLRGVELGPGRFLWRQTQQIAGVDR